MTSQFNENNRLIEIEGIEKIFNKLGIEKYGTDLVQNISNYQLAFVHSSYVRQKVVPVSDQPDIVPFQKQSNEVLEFMGDSILGSYVARYLFDRYPHKDEGFLTTLRSKLVKTESLAKFARFLGFGDHLVISKYVDDQGGRDNPKLLENTFEAFIGAIYRDQGGFASDPTSLYLPHLFIRLVIEKTVDFSELNSRDDNFKDQLMRTFHQVFKGQHAVYVLLKTHGLAHSKQFTSGVVHPKYPNIIVSTGTERKKPMSEQLAAKNAIKKMKDIVNFDHDHDSHRMAKLGFFYYQKE